MSQRSKHEYFAVMYARYRQATAPQKEKLLDELCRVCGYHRKHAIRKLSQPLREPSKRKPPRRGLTYSAQTLSILRAVWEAAGYPWSLRLKALLPLWLPWIKQHFRMTALIEHQLLHISPRQIDRRLQGHKRTLRQRIYGRTKPGTLLKHHIPIRTTHWDVTTPRFVEIDLVAHSGQSASGTYLFSLNLTDIFTGWVETRAVMGKGQQGVVRALTEMCTALPSYVFGFMGNRFLVDNSVEYLSPNFHNVSAWLFLVWILFSILLFGRFIARVSWTHLLLLGAWTAFGLYSARNIPNYAQVATPVTAPVAEVYLSRALPALRVRLENLDRVAPRAGGWAWGIVVVALLASLQANGTRFDAKGIGNVFTQPTFPVQAVDFLERNPLEGNMINEYTWGGYLEYRLFPSQRVFIDGNNDFFGEALVREYLDIINARVGWEEKLAQSDVRRAIIPPESALVLLCHLSCESVMWRSSHSTKARSRRRSTTWRWIVAKD